MVQGNSFSLSEGATFGDLASTNYGAITHELTHAFGMPHDFRNDQNADGNLMGNGLRGVRGAIYPYEYYGTFGHLQYGQALALETNPYMTHLSRVPAGNPTVTWSVGTPSWAAGSPHYGQLPINYTVSDPDGLGSLILQKDGDQTGEVDLSGTSATGTLYTPYFAAGQSQEFALMAYDANANRTRVTRTLVVPAIPAGATAGVQPFIRTGSGTVRVGEPLDLDASSSFGLQSGRVNVEWDYEGDGTYDSPVGAQYARWQANYDTPGDYLVRARFTHQLTGAVVESAPIPVRVLPAEPAPAAVEGRVYQDLNGDARRDPFDFPAAGARVFADSDLDGTYDEGEPTALTDATGRYRIDGMPHGVHVMRVAVPEGYARTAPTAVFGGQAVTLFEGKTVAGVEFGLKETTRPQLVSATLSQDAPGGATAPHRLALQFDEDVSRSLAAGDLSLRDSFSGAVVAPSEMAISFEDGGRRAVVMFPGRPNGRLPAGTWQLAVGAASVTDRAGNALAAPVAQDLAVNSAVAARHLFYNNSAFDLQDSAAGPADDAALAGKTPLLAAPGAAGARVAVLGTSSFDNVTSYAKGINGVMIDVGGAPLQRQWTADDFAFRVGRGGDPAAWESAPAPVAITVRPGAGEGGTDRVSLVWPDGAIRNTWLQVTVLATADTGLSAPDVFYFGNLVGETGARAGAGAAVSALDLWRTRRNFSAAVESAQSLFDHNHDGRVDILDLAIVRANVSRTLAPLVVPATPAESKAPARVAAVLGPVESADLLA